MRLLFCPVCARTGKEPLPSVGFVLALQSLPRSGGGINVFMGSDVLYITRCSNWQSVDQDSDMEDTSRQLRKGLIGTGYMDNFSWCIGAWQNRPSGET